MPVRLIEHDGGVQLVVKVVPGASRDRIVGELGDALKVAVRQPPERGAANAAVAALLSAALGIPAARVQIVRGQTTPRKEIFIAGVRAADVAARLRIRAV